MTYIQKSILIIQILVYLTSILLVFAKPANFFEIVLQSAFAALAVLIKIFRQRKNWRELLKGQLSYYLAYLLVSLEIVFYYKALFQIFDSATVGWSIVNLVVKTINYSLLMHPKTSNTLQLIIYSVGQAIHVVMSIIGTLQIVYIFDYLETADYEKDMILLFTAAVLAQGILVLDLLFRIYQKKQDKKSESRNQLLHNTIQMTNR